MPSARHALTLDVFIVTLGREKYRAGCRIADKPILGPPAADESTAVNQLFYAIGSGRNDDIQLAIDIELAGGKDAFLALIGAGDGDDA